MGWKNDIDDMDDVEGPGDDDTDDGPWLVTFKSSLPIASATSSRR